ncbi:murein hydrolase activator EnvC family protein [Virgibacillus flavescens]|uniref:murein hydrolase activator EnvC family protein n=1 Tax=Virgibacillus flavescens TaxID=1611422 RepID=UPI003D338E8D
MSKLITYLLIAVLVVTSTLVNWQSVSASTIEGAKDKINEIESQKSEVDKKQHKVNEEKEVTEENIDENLTEQEKVTNEIKKIDDKLANTKSSIQAKEQEIKKTNKEIEQLKTDIIELHKSIKKREELLKDRLRTIQKNGGDMRYIEVILGAQNFGDFVSRSSAVNTIMDQDKNIMEVHMAEKRELEEKKNEVLNKKEALESQKQELVTLKSQLDKQIAKKEELMKQLEKEHANLEVNKEELEEESAELHAVEDKLQQEMKSAEAEIQRLQKIAMEKARKAREAREAKAAREQAAREKAAQEQAAKEQAAREAEAKRNSQPAPAPQPAPQLEPVAKVKADFIWPAAGSRTSNYGVRYDPFTNQRSVHGGIDIGGPVGTTIRASISGYAMPVNIDSSYGNHVLVVGEVNGKSYTTLYAHMSGTAIGGGKYVEQGETIGYMGSTGRSTGSHLHFEIHIGSYSGFSSSVNPINYLN